MGCPDLPVTTTVADATEQCCYYSISALVIVIRWCVRLRTKGWRELHADDYISIWVLVCVVMAGFLTVSSLTHGGTWNYVGNEEAAYKLLDCQVARIRLGSIYNVTNWYFYTGLLWGLKAMMLVFLHRLYSGFSPRLIKCVAFTCGLTFLAAYLIITFSCHPIYKNWQVRPLPPQKCMLRKINIFAVSGMNAITDFLILLIPIPLLWTVQVSTCKRIMMALLLCSGVLIVAMALLRISFLNEGFQLGQISKWGSREVMVGTIVVNMPVIIPITKKAFWRRGYGKPTPYQPPPQMGSGGPDGITGTYLMRTKSEYMGAVDLMLPDHANTSPAMTTKRNDSAAATTITTDRLTLTSIGATTIEEVPLSPLSLPRRHSFGVDLERNTSGVDTTTTDDFVNSNLPSQPERALSSSHWSYGRQDSVNAGGKLS